MTTLDLFAPTSHAPENHLPYDGIVDNHGIVLDYSEQETYFNTLMTTIDWRHDEVMIMGKHHTTQRMVALYGDRYFDYSYSGIKHHATIWTPELIALKKIVEQHTHTVFNSCLLNLYKDGSQGMAWHSDDEVALGNETVIASLSLGATRKFCFKHKKTQEKVEMLLPSGQLIVMRGKTQHHWMHAIMKTTKVATPRINLTFRTLQATL